MAGLPVPCGKDSLVFWDDLLWVKNSEDKDADDEDKDAADKGKDAEAEDRDTDGTGQSIMMYLLENSSLVRMG